MPVAAIKSHPRHRDRVAEEENVIEGKVPMASVVARDKSLYVTSGAMFAGLLGVFLFAAPGGVIGAVVGAVAGLLFAQHRPSA
jgi:uncharacterized membrane protein